MLFVGKDFVITVRHGEGAPLKAVRRRLEADKELLHHGPSAVLYTVLDEIVDRYGAIAHEVETDIIDLERRVFSTQRTMVTENIYELKREVLEFRGAEDPLVPVLQDIVKGRVSVAPGTTEYFATSLDHLLARRRTGRLAHELLTKRAERAPRPVACSRTRTCARSRLGGDPRRATMITGVYGMNFTHMPELGQWVGLPGRDAAHRRHLWRPVPLVPQERLAVGAPGRQVAAMAPAASRPNRMPPSATR